MSTVDAAATGREPSPQRLPRAGEGMKRRQETEPRERTGAVGYVVGRYPAVSHAFVQREVQALRRLGARVETISIRRAPNEDLLTEADRQEDRSTFAVLPISFLNLIRTHARASGRSPLRYVSTLLRALRMSPPGLRGHLWQLFYFAEAMIVAEHCRRSGIRHLHAQFAAVAPDVAMLASHYGGPGWSWSLAVHGPVEFYNVERNRLAAKVCDARFVQAISHFGRSQLLAHVAEEHWDKIHVVRCGIDPASYRAPERPDPPAGGELRVLCVGRLVHWKGQSLLLRAAAELVAGGIDVRVDLIGDGPKRRDLAQLASRLGIADRVVLHGAVGQAEIPNRYRAADVFCLPSFSEGLPVVLMEAMAMGLPVVSTQIMGVPELVDDGVSGLLVPPGDLGPLVTALESLAQDADRRSDLGSEARRKVLDQFDVNRSAERLTALFATTLGGRPPARR